MQEQVIHGTWDDVSRQYGPELMGHRVEIRVLDEAIPVRTHRMLSEGMFPQLQAITEKDFSAAKSHDAAIDF